MNSRKLGFEEFIAFYKKLPQVKNTCRIFERNDSYSIYEEDAKLINQEILKASKVKVTKVGLEEFKYVNINRNNLCTVLNHLLFVRQYRIEIFKNEGTVRSPQWSISYKASPGNLTCLEDLLFNEEYTVQKSCGLMALRIVPDQSELVIGVAFCDPVCREIQICQFNDNSDYTNLQSVIVKLGPQECLMPPASVHNNWKSITEMLKIHGVTVTECKLADFSVINVEQDLNRLLHFEEGMDFKTYMSDASSKTQALSAVAAIIKYLELLSDENNFAQYVLSTFKSDLYARLDIQSITGLGLFSKDPEIGGLNARNCLMGHLNNTVTVMGLRLLIQWIKQPLMDLRKLENRLDIVETLVNDINLRVDLSNIIGKFPDFEILSRKIQRKKAKLQDLHKLYVMMIKLPELCKVLSEYEGKHADVLKSNFVSDIKERIDDFSNYISMIEAILDLDAVQNGEFVVKAEYDPQLLEVKQNMNEIEKKIKSLLPGVMQDLDAPVKLECCKVIGYHYRITKKEEKNLRHKKGYAVIDAKQSGVRFQSTSLKICNDQYLSLKKSYEEKQKTIVAAVVDIAATYTQPLKLLTHTIAWLDVSMSLASASVNAPKPYVRPKLRVKGDGCIILKGARHPVLERSRTFIPNDVEINKDKHFFYFVTGPNMGGKSTYIRSVALSVLMAQMGCFVPCDYAEISITDAILTRIGAGDKPELGVSTFFFEMLEINNIIKTATPDSLLIIDEMGRGTSTHDGFGLSWAISRAIAEEVKVPCLFATHFHGLAELSTQIPAISNLHVEAITKGGNIYFLYQVKPGVCEESYGIHVAQMAKFPTSVIEEAKAKLSEIEASHIPIEKTLHQFKDLPNGQIVLNGIMENMDNSASYGLLCKILEDLVKAEI